MLVTLRLFARLREIAGQAELHLEVPDGYDARALWEELARRYPALAPYGASVSCAVNEEYAKLTTSLRHGDEVAFLPPVSGGQTSEPDVARRSARREGGEPNSTTKP
jgi:molybdopterin converting factor subunit 1